MINSREEASVGQAGVTAGLTDVGPAINHLPLEPLVTTHVARAALIGFLLVRPEPAAAQGPIVQEALEWGAFSAVVAGAYLLDTATREKLFVDADSTLPWAARLGDQLGRPVIYYVGLGTLFVGGRLAGNDRLSDSALRTAGALTVTGLTTVAIKVVTGRARPDNPDADRNDFRPLTRDHAWNSFPSGHVTTAFTIATAVAIEGHNHWTTAMAYSVASVVAWSRIRSDNHWLSDVVAGAIISVELAEEILPLLGATSSNGSDSGRDVATIRVQIPIR